MLGLFDEMSVSSSSASSSAKPLLPATGISTSNGMDNIETPEMNTQQEVPSDGHRDLDIIYNVTRELPLEYATVMFGYIMPFLLVLTLITNTLVVMVLAQRHMRTPTNIVLFTMAIVDLLTLLWPSPWYFYIYTLGYNDKFLYPPVACYAHYFMTDVIPVFFHTSSIWLALLLASQRYIYVCHPSLASTWCTVPRVRKAIIFILVIAFLHQSTRFFDSKFESTVIIYNQVQHYACKNLNSDWVLAIDLGIYYRTYFTFRIVFVFIIPCVALITLNCLLFRALRRAENKRSELLKTKFKLVGGNRSSVAGFNDGRQSSFICDSVIKNEPSLANNNNNKATMPNAGPSSNSSNWPTRRKISSPLVRLSMTNNQTEDVENQQQQQQQQRKNKRKFYISSSFRMRRREMAAQNNHHDRDQLFPKITNSHERKTNSNCTTGARTMTTTSPFNQSNDKMPIHDDDHVQRRFNVLTGSDSDGESNQLLIRRDAGEKDHDGTKQSSRSSNNNMEPARARCISVREQGKQRSKESNESGYSVVSNQLSNRDQEDENDQSKSKLSTDNQSTTNGRDDDYNSCPGCAACQQFEDIECRRCLAGSSNTNNGTDHVHNHHQPVSQCSSLIGGGQNTQTTNEEVSSCGITQNMSSSMYVVHDGTLDGIETGSIREEEDEGAMNLVERESLSLHNNNRNEKEKEKEKRTKRNRKSVSADGDAKGRGDNDMMINCISTDSRLACGCPPSPDGKNLYRCNRSNSIRRDHGGCRECCLASQCRKQQKSKIDRGTSNKDQANGQSRNSMQKCIAASCSSSDPCIKCNNMTQESSGCKIASNDTNGSTKLDNINNKETISQCNSDYYGGDRSGAATECNDLEASRKQRSNADIYLDGNAAATTTTTTTLYSTQANSIASLQHQSTQNQTNRHTNRQQSSGAASAQEQTRGLCDATYAKSPSFVSTTLGRGSRATLIGGTGGGIGGNNAGSCLMNPPPALIITGSNPTASIRTMDSNRTTLMLIVVVTVFLMVEVPVAIVTILHVILNSFEVFKDVEFTTYVQYTKVLTNFCIMISYSVNFTIYCSMSKKFRETFRDLFLCGKQARRKRAAGLLYQQTQHSQYMNTNTVNNHNNNNTNPNQFQSHEMTRGQTRPQSIL